LTPDEELEPSDMTKNLESMETTAAKVMAASGRFDRVSIALHWLTVLLIIAQFSSAWLLEAEHAQASAIDRKSQ
jgi:hypothetical protein